MQIQVAICEPNIMCLLYGTLSYPLEDMQTIEKIQRRAIKLIPSLKNIPTTKDVQLEFTKYTVSPT